MKDVNAVSTSLPAIRLGARPSFASVAELEKAIHDYIDVHNRNALPFVWTAEADKIIAKVGRARLALDNERSN